ncbi:hypothetical protein MASR1M60_27920 [Rhodocyclaceae bacterium]
MDKACRDDPVVCIDAVALFIGEFLKDWTTLGMLAILLALLLKLRSDQRAQREKEYALQLADYDEQRQKPFTPTWEMDRPAEK